MDIFKLIGAIGILLICIGILAKKRALQDYLYILGGLCLELYSVHIQDIIFIVLQFIFVASATYDIVMIRVK